MGLFKPVHDEYSDGSFEIYLLYLCAHCGMGAETTLPQARSALEQYCMAYPEFFRSSNLRKQVKRLKNELYRTRNQIARVAQYGGDWSREELAALAERLHKTAIWGVAGDSLPDFIVRKKMELLEQVVVLEVCSELGIDLFNETG